MMRLSRTTSLLTASLLLVVCATASAQEEGRRERGGFPGGGFPGAGPGGFPGGDPGGGFGFRGGGPPGGFSSRGSRGGSLLGELQNEDTQRELGITDEQKQRLQQVGEQAQGNREQFGEIFQRMRSAQSDDERNKLREEMSKRFEEARKSSDDAARSILSEGQVKRVGQIQLHREGPRALSRNEELGRELGLTDSQKGEFEKLNEERDNARRSLGFNTSEEDRNRFSAEWDQKFLAVLTPEQQKQWTEKLGPPPAAGTGSGRSGSGSSSPAAPRVIMFETAPEGAQVKADFGDAPEGKLVFSFQYAPWERVLKMFAEQAKVNLNLNVIPPGTFSYVDPNEYTPLEAIDVLNGLLQPKGYGLIRHDEFLTTVNLDVPIAPNLIPVVKVEELDSRGKHELLSTVFPVEGDVDRIAREIDQLKGPWGRVVPLQAASSISVQDSGQNLRRIRDTLQSFQPRETATTVSYKPYTLKYVPIGEAEIMIRGLLGLPTPSSNSEGRRESSRSSSSSSSSAPQAQLIANPARNQLLVTATKADHERIEAALKDIDVEERSTAAGQFGMNSSVQMTVIPLSKMDPLTAVAQLRPMFVKDEEDAPTIEPDLLNRQIMVRGSSTQVALIKSLLLSLGEDGTGRREASDTTIRSIPLMGRDAEEIIPLLEQFWRSTSPSPIRVINPSQRGTVRDIRSPAAPPAVQNESPELPRPAEQPSTTQRPAEPSQERSRLKIRNPLAAEFAAAMLPEHESQLTAVESTNPDAPPVVISVAGDDLIIHSQDPEQLNQLEDLLERTMSVVPPRTNWVVFTLQSADATECATQLETLIPSSSVSTSSVGTGIMGTVNSLASDLGAMSGIASTGMLRIVPDVRLNALFVSGSPSQIREVEQMLEILDASEWPDSNRSKVYHTIPVQFAQADDVAEIIRANYKGYMEDQSRSQQGNPLQMLMGGRGGSSNNREQNAPPPIQLTVSVNADTNDVIVWCDTDLFLEIEQLVKEIDNRTRAAKPTVQVVTLENTSSTVMQQALGRLLPRVNVSTTGSRSSTTNSSNSPPTGGNSGGGGGGGPSPDDIRRMMEMRERFGGGSPFGGGGPGSSGASPFGGGRPSFGGGSPFGGGGGSPFGGIRPGGFGGVGGDRGSGGNRGGGR